MNTLVINLTRFGDLLQTQPTLTGLRAGGASVGLVCLDTFKGAAALLNDVDRVRVLPGSRLLARLDQDWPAAVAELTSWLTEDAGWLPDRVLNLTPTLPGRLLGRVLDGGEVEGFGLDELGFGHYSTPWAAFLQAASAYRGCSPFNLVDLFQRVAGLDPGEYRLRPPDVGALAAASALLPADGRGLVAFQLGASQDFRRWPVAAFVEAGRVLHTRTGRSPVLLGTASETHLAREFAELADYPFTDLTGRTDLPTLAAVLSRMELLLTNDTGTMHLAAGLGVPVAAVFLATAQPFDTGPYLEGSLSLEPDLPCHPCSFGERCPHGLICRASIGGCGVGELLAGYLRTGVWTPPEGLGARLWRACRDEDGFMDLVSLSGHGEQDRSRWIAVQRDVYRQFLDCRCDAGAQPWRGADSDFRKRLEADLRRGMLMLTLLEEQGRLLSQRPGSPVGAKFLANCTALEAFFAASPALGVLAPMWSFQSRDQSVNIDAFLKLCARYRDLLRVFGDRVALA